MSPIYSYRNPVLSLWQAAVAEVHTRRDSVKLRTAMVTGRRVETRPLAAADDLMLPVHIVAAVLSDQGHERNVRVLEGVSASLARGDAAENVPLDCAKTAAEFLLAEMKGDQDKARVLAGELKFAVCDVVGGASASRPI
jgi:hypothetical protein